MATSRWNHSFLSEKNRRQSLELWFSGLFITSFCFVKITFGFQRKDKLWQTNRKRDRRTWSRRHAPTQLQPIGPWIRSMHRTSRPCNEVYVYFVTYTTIFLSKGRELINRLQFIFISQLFISTILQFQIFYFIFYPAYLFSFLKFLKFVC